MTKARNVTVTQRCPVCLAKPDADCTNTITPGQPLPGRRYHIGRFDGSGHAQWREGS